MLSAAVRASLERHPCYSHRAHFTHGRIHLPVAPECNLGCNYCERRVGGPSYHGQRPAVAEAVLTPEEAVSAVAREAAGGSLAVVGIAGPGEPLFCPSTFETLRRVRDAFPGLMLCVSTNGLLLPGHAELLRELGVRTLTVTLNTVDPEVGARIYRHVKHDSRTLDGVEGAAFLLENQLAGIEQAARLGLAVKVNSVLIPGVNGNGHLVAVAGAAKSLGAYIQNITPLIPLGAFSAIEPPSCEELREVRSECERSIRQFRLCRQCRADAVGIPGREHHRARPGRAQRKGGAR